VEDPELGFVFALGVRRPWRRRGLGLALLAHTFGVLYERGKGRVMLDGNATQSFAAVRFE